MNEQKRYVDINPAIEFLEGYDNSWGQEFADGVRTALHFIKKLPVADVQEVKHAHWGSCAYGTEFWGDATPKCYICSNCHMINDLYTRYCPWCGAKMDEEDGK